MARRSHSRRPRHADAGQDRSRQPRSAEKTLVHADRTDRRHRAFRRHAPRRPRQRVRRVVLAPQSLGASASSFCSSPLPLAGEGRVRALLIPVDHPSFSPSNASQAFPHPNPLPQEEEGTTQPHFTLPFCARSRLAGEVARKAGAETHERSKIPTCPHTFPKILKSRIPASGLSSPPNRSRSKSTIPNSSSSIAAPTSAIQPKAAPITKPATSPAPFSPTSIAISPISHLKDSAAIHSPATPRSPPRFRAGT